MALGCQYCSRTFFIYLFLRFVDVSYGRFIIVRFGFNLSKYRVCINYQRILQNHIFTNTVCDFFLWDFVKDIVYVPPLPKTLPELRELINTAIENATQDMLERVWREWEYRLDIFRITRGDAHRRRSRSL